MMREKTLLALSFCCAFILLISCKPKQELKVTPVSGLSELRTEGLIYALPQTTLRVTVEATEYRTIPGPYYRFAEKYLGVTDVPDSEEVSWGITNIDIDSYEEIDPSQYYFLEPEGRFNFNVDRLIEKGLILPVNLRPDKIISEEFYGMESPSEGIVFTDLSIKQYVTHKKTTYYKRVMRDSLFAKVPVTKDQTVHKTFEEKAEEAANFIILIREKRFELLAGMSDFYPEGESMQVSINELNRLEDEYLSLFTGKQVQRKFSAVFELTPEEMNLSKPTILFRFNDELGVLESTDLRGRPIIAEFERNNLTSSLERILNKRHFEENEEPALYYRIPDNATMRLMDGGSMLARARLSVEQFGSVVPIPAKFLMDEETFIEFYREEK